MWKKNFVEDNESYILMCLFTGLSCRVERIRPVKWSVWLAINQRGRSASCNGVFHSSGDWFFGWPTCRRSCFICRGFLCCFQPPPPPPPPPPPRPPSSCLINEIKGNVQESRTNSNRGGGGSQRSRSIKWIANRLPRWGQRSIWSAGLNWIQSRATGALNELTSESTSSWIELK